MTSIEIFPGIDSQNARSLIVAVSRTGAPLRGRIDQLAGCPGFTSVAGPDRSSVRMNTLPMPPVDADESYAMDQTVTSPTSGASAIFRTASSSTRTPPSSLSRG